jgi:CRP-like cAMP-binding protein
VVVGVLGQGDYFGEMALLTNQPRSADVKASSDCMLLSLGKNDLRVVLQAFPTAKVRILSASSATHSARAYSLLHGVISAH